LYSLQQQLIELMGLVERNPSIEAATGDLYAAVEALVADRTTGSQPITRKLRLLVHAHERFREHLPAARPLKPGREASGFTAVSGLPPDVAKKHFHERATSRLSSRAEWLFAFVLATPSRNRGLTRHYG
jgi:hypothetical protein